MAKEKQVQRSEHRQRQEEEVELLKRIKVEEKLRRTERKGLLKHDIYRIETSTINFGVKTKEVGV
jgi:hypothetical protein